MAKTIKASELNRSGIKNRLNKKKTWEVVGGQPVKKLDPRANMFRLQQKLSKNGTMSATMTNNTSDNMAAAVLASLDISFSYDYNPKKSLLDEEDSSNQIKNTKIVDVTGIQLLQRQKISGENRFGDSVSNPWYKSDMEAPKYVKNLSPQTNYEKTPNMTKVCAAIYTVNEISTKGLGVSMPQLKTK